MFLEPKQYEHVIEILSGKIKPEPLLAQLQEWARRTMEIEVYDFSCDYSKSGFLRLQIILWDREEYREMHCSGNYDPKKQKMFAVKFAELAKAHNVHKEYWNADDIFVSYDTIADEIQKRILQNSKVKIMEIKHPDIWKMENIFEGIHVFYQTDQQIEDHEKDGLSNRIEQMCSEIVKRDDPFGVFEQGIKCVFTSKQTLDEKYAGSMFYYTR